MARPKKSITTKAPAKNKKKGRKPKTIDLKSSLARLTSKSRSSTKTLAAKKAHPLVFTIEDAKEELARLEKLRDEKFSNEQLATPQKTEVTSKDKRSKAPKKKAQVVGAASIMDLLGFDPSSNSNREEDEKAKVPKQLLPYYKSLLQLKKHFTNELDAHSKDSLAIDANSDLDQFSEQTDSDSGQFDREVALSMLASEQDALYEIDEAIQRILSNKYGNCEITGKPIKKQRLRAVPFTRFSLEGQEQFERQQRRGGRGHEEVFAERDDDAARLLVSDDQEE
jgi:RNA polymerase-binding transcription factor DksA